MIDGKTLDRFNQQSSSMHIMTADHHCYFVNDYWRHLHGLHKQVSAVEGLTYSDIPHKAFDHCSELFKNHDQKVFDTRATLCSLEIHEYSACNGWQALRLISQPYIVNNKVLGLIGEALPLPVHLARHYRSVKKQLIEIYDPSSVGKILLSNPDGLCDCTFENAYLLMLGLKPQKIAAVRGVSVNTVYSSLSNLKLRSGVDNYRQLIEYAVEQQWYNHIPAMYREQETTVLLK